ncbi:uncharacterized protein LOC119839288 isoform X1 [Zerene cesonia]|uniref:uncharacterized protein LOC119839288 isoform X1 n=1 Tax=Zerene cesonia TaxID=33412 RepID=UPI0018E53B5C|nr:uncharacterized protein LOC119839288 isoform X1 [Zerene cesonia]
MRLICFWCMVVTAAHAQEYYAPQTFKQGNQLFEPSNLPWNSALRKANEAGPYYRGMFSTEKDADAAGSVSQSWRPGNEAPVYEDYRDKGYTGPQETKPESWRLPYGLSKEQQASILHHKQSLSADGAFRFEYASDNGLAAGEMIEPDGSRVGAYQYKDPSGQLVKLKYRAGKEGFQILEGSHVPKSPQPVPPQNTDAYYQQAYDQQRRQYDVQQQYNQQRPEPTQGPIDPRGAGQNFVQNWRPEGVNDGQYRDNDIDPNRPHSFGEGYAFAFKGKNY